MISYQIYLGVQKRHVAKLYTSKIKSSRDQTESAGRVHLLLSKIYISDETAISMLL